MVEDVATDAELELRELRKAGLVCTCRRVDNEKDLRRELADFMPDIILSDFFLAENFDGQRALALSQELAPGTPFIIVSGIIDQENAIDSLRAGATDFVLKTQLKRLAPAVVRALKNSELQKLQKKAEQEIKEQRAFLRKVIDLDKSVIFAKDREGRFILANEAVARVFGVTVEQLLGKTNADFIPSAEMNKQYQLDELEVMDTRKEKFFPEVKIKNADGNTRWLQTVMSPIISTDGRADMVLAVGTDITERKLMEEDIKRNIDRYEIISRATSDAVWDWDLSSDHLWWNDTFKTLFGYQDYEIEPHINFRVNHMHPDDREMVKNGIDQVIQGNGQYWNDEYRFQRRDGSYAYVQDRGFVMRDGAGKGSRMIGAMMDISGRHEQQLKIDRLHWIRDVLVGINHAIVRIHDREALCQEACRIAVDDGNFVFAWIGLANQDTGEITPIAKYGEDQGYLDTVRFSVREDRVEGQNLVSRALRENKPVISDNVATTPGIQYRRELLERGFRSFAVLPLSVGGEAIGTFTLYSYEVGAFNEDEMKLLREMEADISFALEYIAKEQQLNYLAYYDLLTGLPNRSLISDRLTQALHATENGRIVGLILIDIQRFTYINEVFGRHEGDRLLKEIAGKLRAMVPEPDHVAHVDADKFAALLTDMGSAAEIARFLEEKLVPALHVTHTIGNQQIKISTRIGVVIAPADGHDAETLIKNAEAALKSAKRGDKKYQFYAREMNALIAEKLSLENRLREALEKEEFVVYYQPKIDLVNNSVCGLEALIRWNSTEGLVPPYKFIPLLEETGLILDVGLWVVNRAKLDYHRWLDKGLPAPPISVNVSPVQLRQNDFVTRINGVLKQHSSNGSSLELEITETLIMENLEESIKKLRLFRDDGIGISIDDFGTGYSSLSYISKLPVTALKIDRSFINNMLSSSDDTSIVSAIISLAHSLNLQVIAEGVETLEQANLLKLLRCDQFQGYLFSPPVPFPDIEFMLTERKSFV